MTLGLAVALVVFFLTAVISFLVGSQYGFALGSNQNYARRVEERTYNSEGLLLQTHESFYQVDEDSGILRLANRNSRPRERIL